MFREEFLKKLRFTDTSILKIDCPAMKNTFIKPAIIDKPANLSF